jgi:uncharacterized protein YuzE
MNPPYKVTLQTDTVPIVELDSDVLAAYVRFNFNEVAKTEPVHVDDCIVTVDLDEDDNVIGVELVGVHEFNIEVLMKKAGFAPLPRNVAQRAKYVPAGEVVTA